MGLCPSERTCSYAHDVVVATRWHPAHVVICAPSIGLFVLRMGSCYAGLLNVCSNPRV